MRTRHFAALLPMLALCLAAGFSARAQVSYSVVQAGANVGFANPGYKGAFSGFAAHFIFGRNFDDRAYLGFGLGNEALRGDYRAAGPNGPDQRQMRYDYSLFPLFLDGRLPLALAGPNGRIGFVANGGYAPAIAAQYDRGLLFKGGLFYLIEKPNSVNFTVSAGYGYQQLVRNYFGRDFRHQHLALSVGLMFK